jgi:hypothetical protein
VLTSSIARLVDAGKRVAAKEQPRARADMSKVTSVAGAAAAIDAALVGRSAYDDSTPKGRIMNASRRIGLEMAKLSQAAQRGDKKEIIRATKYVPSVRAACAVACAVARVVSDLLPSLSVCALA